MSLKSELSKKREKDKSDKGNNFGGKGKAKIEEINKVESLVDAHMHE